MTRRDAFIASVIFVVIVLVCAFVAPSSDGGGGHKKTPATTTTTKPGGTSTTANPSTSTPSGSSTTSTSTTTPTGSNGCPSSGFGSLFCTPADPGTPTDPPPGDGSTTACENGKVTSAFRWFSQQEGKAAPNNFAIDPTALPAEPVIDPTDPSAGDQFLALMQYQSCLDPARLVADLVASDLVKTRDETKLNQFVEQLKSDTKLRKEWYRKLVKHRNDVVETYVWKSNGQPYRTMDMVNDADAKAYPRLKFTEGKGSCTHVLVLKFKDGRIEVYCVECGLQPRWEIPTPEAPPATPVTPRTPTTTAPPVVTTTAPPVTTTTRPVVTTTTSPITTTTQLVCPPGTIKKDGRCEKPPDSED